MPTYIVIQNHPVEGLGTLKQFLGSGIDMITMSAENLTGGERFDGLIILGGPMGVYEMEKYPQLRVELELIRKAIKENKRVLGICLGAQLLSHALGGTVVKGGLGPEVGVGKVRFTGRLAELHEVEVFQWHGDTFSLPEGSELLAYSNRYFQAFYFRRALGLQFHVEVNARMVEEWIRTYGGDPGLTREVEKREDHFMRIARYLVEWWLRL
ncbi:type 1 glutamine amidotransferase [Metallosphaera javensis (ex Sakai et al. 2022)]|uniref:type 1 glutamine amidotransferase n=1 Tax=Metallosphaera javensis (ex Sakai et al. 2022) TaxID=2775498 RepID=UPI00258CD63A|nr:MAG: GMP synthase [glutamine-hydrolyzing] subunit A [Metallosphaera javensis (ex Sakai et al. 2022)]